MMIGYGISLKGRIEFKRKKYKSAINNLKESIPFIIQDENFQILSGYYLLLAKSHSKLGNVNKSLQYYLKIDSIFFTKKNYYRSQKPAYKYLISHYKKENNYTKQLEYINKYITIDSVLNARSKSINKSLTENYDIPNLLAEKKVIENRLKGDLSTTKKWVFGIGVFAFLLLIFLMQQSRKRKSYKQRFEELMNAPIQETSSIKQTKRNKKTIFRKKLLRVSYFYWNSLKVIKIIFLVISPY